MVTKKTSEETVLVNPSETCSTSCCICQKGFWWSVLRITVAVVVISGAYIAGVICGGSRGEWEGEDHDEYRGGQMSMQMMRHSGPMEREKMPMSDMSNMSHDPMAMSMADMRKMLEGKTGDVLDKAFLEGMIPHHQAAVDMAKYLAGSKHPELVKLGADIIATQTKEIEQMKKWQIAWGYVSTGSTTQTGTMMHMMPDGTMMQM